MNIPSNSEYPCLLVPDNNGQQKRLPLPLREASVGRDPSNDICIRDHLVSKFHAKLLISNQSVTVVDLESANKTRINGQIVTHAAVGFGDELQFARVKCQLVLHASEQHLPSKSV